MIEKIIMRVIFGAVLCIAGYFFVKDYFERGVKIEQLETQKEVQETIIHTQTETRQNAEKEKHKAIAIFDNNDFAKAAKRKPDWVSRLINNAVDERWSLFECSTDSTCVQPSEPNSTR